MEQFQKEEKILKSLMKHSHVELPFQDFEDRLMDKILDEKHKKKSVQNNIRFAWLFFFVGLFLGLLITSLTTQLDYQLNGIPLKKLAFYLQIGVALVLLFQFERLLTLTFRNKD